MTRGHDAVIGPGLHRLRVRAALRPQNGAVPDTIMLSVLSAFAVHQAATNEESGPQSGAPLQDVCFVVFILFGF